MPLTSDGDFDPRNHRGFLIAGYESESLADVPVEKVGTVNSLLLEADELELDEQKAFCIRWLALAGAVDSKRAKLAANVAIHDEALRVMEAENRAKVARTVSDEPVM